EGDPDAAKTPPSGGNLGEAAAVRSLLDGAGFADVEVAPVRREWRLPGAEELVAALRRGTGRTAALIAAPPPAALPAVGATIARAASPCRRDQGYAIPLVALLGRGIKPG